MRITKPNEVGAMPPILQRFLVGTILLTMAALITKFVCANLLHLGPQYGYYFMPSRLRFVDFICFIPRFQRFHHADFFAPSHGLAFTYPAPNALIYQFFYFCFIHGIKVFAASCFLCAAAAGFAFSRALERRGLSRRNAFLFVACSLCTSYPLFFNAWVGNTEIALTVVLGLGLFFFLIRWSWLAAMCFGVAAALKIYPLIFLALLVGRKQYRQLVFALAVYMTVNIASMWLICGSVETAWRGIQGGLAYYQQHYVLGFASSDIAIDHSLFGFIKSSIVILGLNHPSTTTLANILRVFLLVAGCVAILLYFLRIRKLPITNQILCLVVITLTFSPGSKEFTLMNLYVPWGLLALTAVTAYRRKQTVDGLAAAFICLLLLLVPLTEVLIRGNSLNGQLKTVILLALLVIGLKYPFSEVEEPRLPQTSLVSQEA